MIDHATKARDALRRLVGLDTRATPFGTSADYWERRYATHGNSGPGSYDRLATFKATYLNGLVDRLGIRCVIEFGSGDGAQLALARYPSYVGVDVSRTAVSMCRNRYADDRSKRFATLAEHEAEPATADMALSLDVVYHLVEDDVFERHMAALFAAADRAVVVYSSDREETWPDRHVRHRGFTDWVAARAPSWRLAEVERNAHPYDPARPRDTSFADFHLFVRC